MARFAKSLTLHIFIQVHLDASCTMQCSHSLVHLDVAHLDATYSDFVHQDANTHSCNKQVLICNFTARTIPPEALLPSRSAHLGLLFFAISPSWAALAALFAMPPAGDPRQLWIGSIPGGLQEWEVLEVLEAYSVRPYKLILRSRHSSQDYYNNRYNSTVKLSTKTTSICIMLKRTQTSRFLTSN